MWRFILVIYIIMKLNLNSSTLDGLRQTDRLGDREEIHHGGPSKGNRLLSAEIYLLHRRRNSVCGFFCVQISV